MEEHSGADTIPIYADDGKTLIAVITIIETMGGTGYERGYVILLNGPDPEDDIEYEYKRQGGIYYVLIDGEWVAMPPNWKPGDLPKP